MPKPLPLLVGKPICGAPFEALEVPFEAGFGFGFGATAGLAFTGGGTFFAPLEGAGTGAGGAGIDLCTGGCGAAGCFGFGGTLLRYVDGHHPSTPLPFFTSHHPEFLLVNVIF